VVKRASSRHLKIAAGEQQPLRLEGRDLNQVAKVLLMERKKPVRGSHVTVKRKSRNRLDLIVSADKGVKQGRYGLGLVVGRDTVVVSDKVVTVEVIRAKQVSRRKPAATSGSKAPAKGHAAKSGAPAALSVKSAKPGHLVLVPGGKEMSVTLRGSHLEQATRAEVVLGKKSVRQIRVRIKKKSASALTLTLKADGKAARGKKYQLRIEAGKKPLLLAGHTLAIEVTAAGKSGRHQPVKK